MRISEERLVKSRLERDPKQALQYLGAHDPLGSLAMEVAADRIVGKGCQFQEPLR